MLIYPYINQLLTTLGVFCVLFVRLLLMVDEAREVRRLNSAHPFALVVEHIELVTRWVKVTFC